MNKYYAINQYIKAPTVRVIDEQGKQVGVMVIGEALRRAHEVDKDLVEIASKAQPPVCKIIDFKKFQFQENKKDQENKKKSKQVDIKEIWLYPFIAQNDLNIRLNKASEFLKEGNRVKIIIKFRGREITKKDFGYELARKITEQLSGCSQIDGEPRMIGKQLSMLYNSLKKGVCEKNEVKN